MALVDSQRRLCIYLAMLAAFCGGGDAPAQNAAGDPGSGRRLAQQWCAECHAITPTRPGGPNPAAPTFVNLANDPAVTAARIRAVFRTPHRNMPETLLSDSQIDDIVSFVASLKDR